MTLEQKGRKIGVRKLYLHNSVDVTSLAVVLYYLFAANNTITYSDVESRIRQVDNVLDTWYNRPYERPAGFSRSFDDAFIIAHTYFPNIEYRFVQQAVKSLYTLGLNKWHCATVHKLVHGRCGRSLQAITEHLEKLGLNYYEK